MGSANLSMPFFLLLAALASWAGGLMLVIRSNWSAHTLYAMVSVGAGLLTALTTLDLLPRSIGHGHSAYMAVVLLGFLLLFATDALLHQNQPQQVRVAGLMAGFLIHSFLEGVSLVASFRVDPSLGVTLLAAMILHKLPDGITVASLLLVSTNNKIKALLGTGALGMATLVGAWGMIAAGTWITPERLQIVLALTTGIFLYVSLSHLVPFVLQSGQPRLHLFFVGGVLLYMLLSLVLRFHPHV
ncbi:ZIP family metal transporter [Brevibacillus humidisoli]|uniref:ZIP family metal transporter n=1 Tax=Brevibacillus humidisoli TaxID=2895522 RepID=UPI001E5A85F8|nr:ZIP family metal transporter [Brevibacillus humidisoli]UFJ41693.1 ZIP family metal transporter [Brevibacillus humidisoli]